MSERPYIRDIDSVGRRIERWKAAPPDHKRTPDQGSPESTKEQAEAAEKGISMQMLCSKVGNGHGLESAPANLRKSRKLRSPTSTMAPADRSLSPL
jgi:hypothetical protein